MLQKSGSAETSVGYDTVKLYHDTDADTFTGKVS